jgi:hypothetical protein
MQEVWDTVEEQHDAPHDTYAVKTNDWNKNGSRDTNLPTMNKDFDTTCHPKIDASKVQGKRKTPTTYKTSW